MSDLQKRLLDKIVKNENGCWLWQAYIGPKGYGQITLNRRPTKAHRASYEAFKGPIPEGTEIDHLCRVRNCINPEHLEAVSKRENIMRGESFGALNAQKTHCPKGHPYDESNTGFRKNGHRRCIACDKKHNQEQTIRDAQRRRALRAVANGNLEVMEESVTFAKELESLINRYSKERGSRTPDFILAQYLLECLKAFEFAMMARDTWYLSAPKDFTEKSG